MNPPPRQVLHTNVVKPLVRNDKSGFIADSMEGTTAEEDYTVKGENEDVEQRRAHVENGMVEQDTKAQREKQGTNQGGGNVPPSREVPDRNTASEEIKETDNLLVTATEYTIGTQEDQWSTEIAHTHQAESPKDEHRNLSGGNGEPPSRGVPAHIVDNETTSPADAPHSVSPAAKASEASEEEAIFT